MKRALSPAHRSRSADAAFRDADEDYSLNVIAVHQESLSERWAAEVCERISQLAGRDAVRVRTGRMSELGAGAAFGDPVSETACADVIVIALQAAEEMPQGLCAWIDSWLPHRLQLTGALVALIGRDEGAATHADRAKDYLYAVARKAGMDFLVEEHALPEAPPQPRAGMPETAFLARGRILYPAFDPDPPAMPDVRHWGINE